MKLHNLKYLVCVASVAALLVGLSAVPTLATPYSDAVSALSPISYYQFNGAITAGGTAVDEGSRATNATYNGGVAVGAGIPLPGIGGQSLQLTGSADAAATDAGLPASNSSRTVAMWIKTSEAAGPSVSYNPMLYYGSNSTGSAVFVFVPWNGDGNSNPNPITAGFPTTGTKGNFGLSQYGNGLGGTSWANDGAWHFVAYTQTPNGGANADFRVYFDGVLDDGITGYGTKTMQSNTALSGTFLIGRDNLGDQYTGLIAQVSVFGAALSDQQIANLYAMALVPEPSTFALLGLGAIGLAIRTRRRRTAA